VSGGEVRHVVGEIESQPACWRRAAAVEAAALPRPGERVAVAGCGTSLFMARAYAARREAAGLGETDAFAASEMPANRAYDRVLALTRSGTTTEVLDLLGRLRGSAPTVVVTADPDAPAGRAADAAVVLDFADERSVVQTRFATSALALLRAHLGEDLEPVAAEGEAALAAPLPDGALERAQFTFLGRGWTVGVAEEAALKLREAALAWAEAYPAMEYRHGPISIADERSLVWLFGDPPAGLRDEVEATGARVVAEPAGDPQAELIRAQRLAVVLAEARNLDPDRPRHLTRAVVLPGGEEGG
jgi:fructoselysine-6-P-deglycase FrlB-like protein